MKLAPLAVGIATIGLVGLSGPAFAAGPPYTVSVGGSSSPASHPFTAHSTGSVTMNYRNSAGTVVNWNCSSIDFTGSVTSGTGVNPPVQIVASTWSGCTYPGAAATVARLGPWAFSGESGNATMGAETVAGRVNGVSANFQQSANPNVCRSNFSGEMAATFSEAAQRLTVSEIGHAGSLGPRTSTVFSEWLRMPTQ